MSKFSLRAILILFCLLASVFIFSVYTRPALAQENETLPTGDFKDLREAGIAEVAAVIDPKTIQLVDGRIVRLSELDFPDYDPDNPGPLSVMAMDVLQDMLTNKSVYLHQTAKKDFGRTNQMGHHLAHIERQSDKAWAQGALLALGLARAKTTQRNPEMADQMYRLERQAREAKSGIWAEDAGYPVLTPEQAMGRLQSFQIIEGTVHSATIKQNRIYINFGADWRTDFTISIAPQSRRLFSRAGLDPLQWNGRKIRVRGWLEEYNGPYIEIDHPQALEFLDSPPAAPAQNPVTQPLPDASEEPMVKSIQTIR